jgi:hypothetical protein
MSPPTCLVPIKAATEPWPHQNIADLTKGTISTMQFKTYCSDSLL